MQTIYRSVAKDHPVNKKPRNFAQANLACEYTTYSVKHDPKNKLTKRVICQTLTKLKNIFTKCTFVLLLDLFGGL